MTGELNRDFLNKKLYVPLMVRDLLLGGRLKDQERYSLHEIISDFQPDSALLAMALATLEITNTQGYPTTSLKFLRNHCERIVDEYGPLWLEHAQAKKVNDTVLFETLAKIPEDLETLAELLQINADFLRDHDKKAAALLDIFVIQSNAHSIIAGEYVDVMDAGPMPELAPAVFSGNVIPFRPRIQ